MRGKREIAPSPENQRLAIEPPPDPVAGLLPWHLSALPRVRSATRHQLAAEAVLRRGPVWVLASFDA
jgi:hypothetical protein